MLGTKYQVVVFKHNEGQRLNFGMRGWILPALGLLLLALTASNAFLWFYFKDFEVLRYRLAGVDSKILEQQDALLTRAYDIKSLKSEMSRIASFNSKLRVMLTLDKDNYDLGPVNSAVGGSETEPWDFVLQRPQWMSRDMHRIIRDLAADMRVEEADQQRIIAALVVQKDKFTRIPSIWPTRGRYSSGFGYRRSPFTGRGQFHKGIDITARTGTPIISPASGRVIGTERSPSYGLVIEIKHDSGLMTRYAHLSGFAVNVGQKVTRGQTVGYVGSTGRSTAPHLHYEVHVKGRVVNPLHYILN